MPKNSHCYAVVVSKVLLIAWISLSDTNAQCQNPPEPAPSPYLQPSLRKFAFKHAISADALKILQQLTGEYSNGVAVDERTNSLIYLADNEDASELEKLCTVLDTETPSPNIAGSGISLSVPALGTQQQSPTFSFSIGIVRGESIESLKQRQNELEQQAHQLANKLKQSTSLSDAQRKELQLAVRKSFDARQALQRAELADFAGRMKSMQLSIDMRDKLADKVVERRVEDLLNPNLKWDLLAAKERTLDGPVRESTDATTTTAQSAPNTPALTPGGSDSLPPSMAPATTSVPYDPGQRPETIIMERIQGHWIAESFLSKGKNCLNDYSEPFEVLIAGNEMRFKVGEQDMHGPMLLTGPKGSYRSLERSEQPLPMDIVINPNGEQLELPGIIASDGLTLSICYTDEDESKKNGFRPTSFIPGSKVTVIKCHRAPGSTAANKPGEANLSTPQATLDYLHRYSLAHPGGFPAECYTDEALLELSGMMLQNLSMMSALSQIAVQTGGVIGENDGDPVVSGVSPAFHVQVEALLKEHMWTGPTESADRAFGLLAKRTFGSKSSNALVHADRKLIRMAAGVLKSPKEFLPAADKLLTSFGETDANATKSKEAAKTQPKADIAINGDEATATFISSADDSSPSPLTAPRVTKLRRIDGRWLISEILTDEEITQMQSSYSSMMDPFGGATEVKSDKSKSSESEKQKSPTSVAESSKTASSEWNDFLQLLPESGTALVMFAYEQETQEQMSPVAKKVAEAASVQFIELSQSKWNKIIAPPATHFVLMKDRQLVGSRTGLMTETRLQDFVSKAKDWLTPRSAGIDENSLVRIDCFINPGTDNIGSLHGEAFPMTTAVVAVHADQALLLGGEAIGEYIAKGYACVAVVRDAYGKQRQLPLDVVLTGPVKLAARDKDSKKSAATASISFGDGASKEIPLPFLDSIYPKSFTESLEAYDVGSAIYSISGAHGLTPVKLAAVNDPPKVDQRVLSGSFALTNHSPPLHGFRSPIHWQSQTVPKAGGHIYGVNINGAEMFEVLCPTRPAPCGFTFNEHGRLVGRYGLGEPSEKDMTHTVFKPDTTHSILLATLEKIGAPGLKAALAQTLEESKTAVSIQDKNRPTTGDAASVKPSQPSTSPPAKFDSPQALLARVDECSNNGSYEEFVSLFSDEGVRDLAGSLIVSAMQVTTMTELAKQNGGDLGQGPACIQEALNRWLKPNPTPEQKQAASEALSLMFLVGFGGPVQDRSVITAYAEGVRKSAERVTDFRKFSVDMLKAYHELTGEPFGYFGKEKDREWQVTLSADKTIATVVMKTEQPPAPAAIGSNIVEKYSVSNGSEQLPVMTLTNLDGTWRISSLFDELLNVVKPNMEAPSAAAPEQSKSKMITRRYSVGSFVTESFFVGEGNYDLKEVYEKYETDIEQSLEDLAKTVTATCTQPPKFVQVLSSSRCLLIGQTEAGHQEIANFMSDIGINNDRIRLRGFAIEITKDEAKTLGIELTQRVLSPEESEKLRDFQKDKKTESKNSSHEVSIITMDETIQSGTQTHVKTSTVGLQFPFAARIVPDSKEVQIRMDFEGRSGGVEFVTPRIKTLNDGESVLLEFGDDDYWLATADIVHDAK